MNNEIKDEAVTNADLLEKVGNYCPKSVDASKLQAITYEGFGPGSCAIIVDCLTDNKKRTVSEIRHIFSKGMGNLGSIGCASRLFNYVGTITVLK